MDISYRLTILLGLALLSSAPTASASTPEEVDVNFSFKLTGTTCSFDPATVSQNIRLPDVSTSLGANQYTDWTSANLTVTQCDPAVAKLTFEFDGTAATADTFQVTSQPGLAMELWSGANGGGTQVKPNVAMAPVAKVANGGTYTFSARLLHRGTTALIPQSNVQTPLTLKINYL